MKNQQSKIKAFCLLAVVLLAGGSMQAQLPANTWSNWGVVILNNGHSPTNGICTNTRSKYTVTFADSLGFPLVEVSHLNTSNFQDMRYRYLPPNMRVLDAAAYDSTTVYFCGSMDNRGYVARLAIVPTFTSDVPMLAYLDTIFITGTVEVSRLTAYPSVTGGGECVAAIATAPDGSQRRLLLTAQLTGGMLTGDYMLFDVCGDYRLSEVAATDSTVVFGALDVALGQLVLNYNRKSTNLLNGDYVAYTAITYQGNNDLVLAAVGGDTLVAAHNHLLVNDGAVTLRVFDCQTENQVRLKALRSGNLWRLFDMTYLEGYHHVLVMADDGSVRRAVATNPHNPASAIAHIWNLGANGYTTVARQSGTHFVASNGQKECYQEADAAAFSCFEMQPFEILNYGRETGERLDCTTTLMARGRFEFTEWRSYYKNGKIQTKCNIPYEVKEPEQ